jgi:hypothetical protein
MKSDNKFKSSAVFLFAHQDDEFGVFQKIFDELGAGRNVYCIYLTTGVPLGCLSEKRNQESVSVLMSLGVLRENILFIGGDLLIQDGGLMDNLVIARSWLRSWISHVSNIHSIYLPAWEGGHPDHDSLHAIGVIVANELSFLDSVWQYPLYNGYRCRGQLFRVLKALPSNGAILNRKISLHNRFKFLGLMMQYPSQTKTWIGLFPFVLFHYIFFGTQSIQRASLLNIYKPPHSEYLYYERRKFSTWKKMLEKIKMLS